MKIPKDYISLPERARSAAPEVLLALAKDFVFITTISELENLLSAYLPLLFPDTAYLLYDMPATAAGPELLISSAESIPHFLTKDLLENICHKDSVVQLPARKKASCFITGTGIAISNRKQRAGFLLYSPAPENLSDKSLINYIADLLAAALGHIFQYREAALQLEHLQQQQAKLAAERFRLQQEVVSDRNDEMIGSGKVMQEVFQLVEQVALSDSSVLVLGETGTGKELVAKAIHRGSRRKDKFLISLNCAALPAQLVESELFGHERGSFTGAYERRIGKFEIASGGTLFLDEIGELSPELQAKLLRALQEKEIERIGGHTIIKTDVRIIAATNRNLQQEVAEGRFRSDLYYRLNVVPVILPPLRDRKEDIPLLVRHFAERFARKLGRPEPVIPLAALKILSAYNWPGNIRELEHIIERSVLLARDNKIRNIHLPDLKTGTTGSYKPAVLKTLKDVEREHILTVLKKCGNRVYGPGAAAEILGLPVSTLNSKMKKLGIYKEETFRTKDIN